MLPFGTRSEEMTNVIIARNLDRFDISPNQKNSQGCSPEQGKLKRRELSNYFIRVFLYMFEDIKYHCTMGVLINIDKKIKIR